MDRPTIGVLWDSEVDWCGEEPSSKDAINEGYRVFSDIADDNGAEVVIGKFSWYSDCRLEEGYVLRDGRWHKVNDRALDVVFDKFRFDEETLKVKRKINSELPVLNSLELERMCKDKLLTYERFDEKVPETKKASEDVVSDLLDRYERVVLKPRYDFGGKGVDVIESLSEFEPRENLLAQRFVDSSDGIDALGIDGVHDLRIIFVDGEASTCFVRTPEEGFVSNVSRGGSMHHFELSEIPDRALQVVEQVEDVFKDMGNRVYAVDLIFDEEGVPWILEMNSKPGLVFYGDDSIREWKQPLMEEVVETLIDMSR
jgi:glutathione synthase/RimK-type ligase-like ATP-grasp enzyme